MKNSLIVMSNVETGEPFVLHVDEIRAVQTWGDESRVTSPKGAVIVAESVAEIMAQYHGDITPVLDGDPTATVSHANNYLTVKNMMNAENLSVRAVNIISAACEALFDNDPNLEPPAYEMVPLVWLKPFKQQFWANQHCSTDEIGTQIYEAIQKHLDA